MVGEHASDCIGGSKKRSLTSPGVMGTAEGSKISPPLKKLKQARLPFTVISSPSPNQCSKSLATDPLPTKKRKLSTAEKSPLAGQLKAKVSDGRPANKKTPDPSGQKLSAKRLVATPPPLPKVSRIETIDVDEPEVTSSCEDKDARKTVPTLSSTSSSSSSVTPKKSSSVCKPKSLDSFLQTTQQPQVSTSDAVEIVDLCDDDDDDVGEEPQDKDVPEALPSAGGGTTADDASPPEKDDDQPSSLNEREVSSPSELTAEWDEAAREERPLDMDASMSSCPDELNASTAKLSYDADSEDCDEDEAREGSPRTGGSSESNGDTAKCPVTPARLEKPAKKTPLSAKGLQKLKEKEALKEAKLKLRMEKKRKLEEEEAERKRQKFELRRQKEEEREQLRQQKEAERDEKRKEKQQKKELDEKEKEQKKMAREDERKKKQEIIDAKMEEKRKKNEEKQRQEDEKRLQEDEKREKEAKQKNFFKSFFKEAAAPVKKPQEPQTCGWFAPFQVQESMVLAPLRRSRRLLDPSQEFETTFQSQKSTSLYLDKLKGKCYTVGKMGRTRQGDVGRKGCSSGASTTPGDAMQQDKDSSQEVAMVPTPSRDSKMRMKCKLLQFHENYRPAYYGTWRRRSEAINPRNYLQKDEELLDYDVDSNEEWEEPGESLSHSEGEDDGEEVDEGAESDDGFFVPHGYLSESEGCEDEEEVENWKERREAKAKTWEVERRRQQGILKPIIVGCFWTASGSSGSASAAKTLGGYKAVVLTSIPIDLRSRRQLAAANEAAQAAELSSSKLAGQSKGIGMEGMSQKRPVPAEAMPDLIRLVHGNVAGIKTLQREFREYWRRREVSKRSGKSTPRPDTPSAAAAGAAAAAASSSAAKTEASPERTSAEASPLRPGSSADDAPVMPEPACPSPTPMDTSVGEDVGTPEPSKTGATSPGTVGAECRAECSISKRQLMITIGAVAVRERRPVFHKTCWYVHRTVLEKHGLLDLPVPCQWQNLTKPQKAVRAESPLVGFVQPAGLKQHAQGSYAVPAAAGLPQIQSVGAVQASLNPAFYAAANPLVLQVPGPCYQGQERLQGGINSLGQPSLSVASALPATASIQPLLQQVDGSAAAAAATPVPLQLGNNMYACEIMQRLSATVPPPPQQLLQQQQQQLSVSNPASSSQGHIFSPIATADQLHYLNMLPKPTAAGLYASPTLSGPLPAGQTLRPSLGQVVKIPRTSPSQDIKALLFSQAAKASPVSSEPLPQQASQIARATPTSEAEHPLPQMPNRLVSQSPTSTQQAAAKKVATLKSFFNVSAKDPPEVAQTEISETCIDAGSPTDVGESVKREESVREDSSVVVPSVEEPRSLIKEEIPGPVEANCSDEKMNVERCQEGELKKTDSINIENGNCSLDGTTE